MSETHYTQQDREAIAAALVEFADNTDLLYPPLLALREAAAMLRQAATDAEALAAKDERIEALRSESMVMAGGIGSLQIALAAKDAEIARLNEQNSSRVDDAERALDAQRQKVREQADEIATLRKKLEAR